MGTNVFPETRLISALRRHLACHLAAATRGPQIPPQAVPHILFFLRMETTPVVTRDTLLRLVHKRRHEHAWADWISSLPDERLTENTRDEVAKRLKRRGGPPRHGDASDASALSLSLACADVQQPRVPDVNEACSATPDKARIAQLEKELELERQRGHAKLMHACKVAQKRFAELKDLLDVEEKRADKNAAMFRLLVKIVHAHDRDGREKSAQVLAADTTHSAKWVVNQLCEACAYDRDTLKLFCQTCWPERFA